MKTHLPDFVTTSPDKLDVCINRQADSDKLISYVYNVLQNINAPSSEVYKRACRQIPDELWDDSFHYIQTHSINARHCRIQFKSATPAILLEIQTE